ncbi:MAG: bifunctional (p)ppGpp synthetase/guanosine-3',5'-bis(diphosphate) 3'-pyrophosphohydrolase [Candidatus Poribacteria bacterium]|nr:bifunctional (p)ppGpp synthetase/guanosine-3',5'-bis(diphosphate) 3'-pyrophosphohydrolase [Candidatus Poribacteria bacterium]
MQFNDLMQRVREYLPNLDERDAALFQKAYEYAENAHEGVKRRSGCEYFVHCYEVARILTTLRMDVPTLCSGLLHDVLEDTEITQEQLADAFTPEIAILVDAVTKLSALEFRRVEERQAENYRKMVIAMARDVRVIIVKLADRLHNMETIQYMPEARQRGIAKETLEIYAPLAHRLGIHRMRVDLEDLAFKVLDPPMYREIAQRVAEKRDEREAYTERMAKEIRMELERNGIKDADVFGRPKHLYSIYQKMTVRGVPFEDIYDLIAFRVLVASVRDCYLAMGGIHGRWMPMPERFKDYIATPRSNMYQSLHTTIIDHGRPIEVQIRTHDMHRVAEFGIAAHWRYKEDGSRALTQKQAASIEQFSWLRQLIEQIQEVRNPNEFLQSVRGELFDDEIFVFTPKGDMKVFRQGATPIDFAFAIHTDIGLRTTGAKVNGRIVPLKSALKSGDIVEVSTDADPKPSRDWLRYVKTARARNKIKHWFREQEFDQNVALGRRLLETELRDHRLTPKTVLTPERLDELVEEFAVASVEHFYADIANQQISPQRVYHHLVPPEQRPEQEPPTKPKPVRMVGIRLDGYAAAETRVAKCCNPLPGDDVVGYITRGRGITVHRRDCERITGEFERIIPIEWYSSEQEAYPVEIEIECDDRRGLLADVAEAISEIGVNIQSGGINTPDSFTALQRWTVNVRDDRELDTVKRAVLKVQGVRKITRRNVR